MYIVRCSVLHLGLSLFSFWLALSPQDKRIGDCSADTECANAYVLKALQMAPIGLNHSVCTVGATKTDCLPGSDFNANDLVASG
mmetsp:Transcript_2573/g.4117  ORF Transcript_2573/g.4117 Transcript_2573/m.4117 type:complete len:84 (-) Transcript_2573:209-460(-)